VVDEEAAVPRQVEDQRAVGGTLRPAPLPPGDGALLPRFDPLPLERISTWNSIAFGGSAAKAGEKPRLKINIP